MKILNSTSINLFLKNKQSFFFIAINVFVAFLGFIRSFAFMKFFDFSELGLITLINTSVMLVGFFQLGLINGAYRIVALQESESNVKVNNVIFSYFTLLFFALIVISSIGFILSLFTDLSLVLLVISIGILTLITNWLTNSLIGSREYGKLNAANFLSAFASLLCLVLAYFYGLWGAIISLLIQPLLFILITFLTNKITIPTKFDIDFKYIRYILNFGFIPFLSGIFVLIYAQIERWSINFFLGSEALGKMYMVFLVATLWVLVPSSILNLFFPKAIKFYSDNDLTNFNKIIRKNAIVTLIYCIVVSLLIIVLLQPIVSFIFPKHQSFVFLVVIGLPGLIFRTLSDPIALYLNSIVKLKPIFWSDVLALIIYFLSILILLSLKLFSLTNFVVCFNVYFIFKFIYLFISYFKLRDKYQ